MIIYKKICVSLMLINNNVYTFLSGILISFSVNIFTSLCFEKSGFCKSWFMYLASLVYLLVSAICMYLAAKLSKFQNYIIGKHITDYEDKKSIVLDATKKNYKKWVAIYSITALMFVIGIVLLVFNFV